jgi:hypothetical protein
MQSHDNWCQKWDWIENCSGWVYHQPTKMEQMMERLVAAIEKMGAKTDTNQKQVKTGKNT